MMDTKSPWLAEYEALTGKGGYYPLTDWTSVTFTGADRGAFLHNFCTNDVKRLQPGGACEAFLTDVKGKIIGHGLITCRDEELVLVTVPGEATGIVEHLDRYLIREDVKLIDTTADRQLALVAGPKADELARTAGRPLFACDWLGNIQAWLVEGEFSPKLLAEQRVLPCRAGAFHAARVEAGFPLYGIDFDRSNLPQEIGRDARAISFTKGCYLGQETVARIDALGHVNRRLVGVRLTSAEVPEPPLELTRDGVPVGKATSFVFSPRLNAPLGLAIVRREASQPGTTLLTAAGACEILALPVS
jgi:folate-binding protein YgfZ